jgi:hypothetical protein
LILAVAAVSLTACTSNEPRPAACSTVPDESNGASTVFLGGGYVRWVAAGPAGLWVIVDNHGQTGPSDLVEVDPSTRKILGQPLALSFWASGLAVGKDAVWVIGIPAKVKPGPGRLVKIEPRSRRILADIHLSHAPNDVSIDGNAIWVASSRERTVSRFNLAGGRERTIRPGFGPDHILARGGVVWALNEFGEVKLHRIDPSIGQVTAEVPGLSFDVGPGAVWVVGNGPPNGRLQRLNPVTLKSDGPALGFDILPASVAVVGDEVWVGQISRCDSNRPFGLGSVAWFRINPRTLKPQSGPVHVGAEPRAPAFAGGALWFSPGLGNTMTRLDLATARKVRPQANAPVAGGPRT